MATGSISGDALADKQVVVSSGFSVGNKTFLNRVYVSDVLAAQPITGAFKAQLQGFESPSNGRVYPNYVVNIISSSGSIVKKLVSGIGGNPFTGTNQNRNMNISMVTSGSVPSGGRLSFEIGFFYIHPANSGDILSEQFGDPQSTPDLPEDITTTGNFRPWIEFKKTII